MDKDVSVIIPTFNRSGALVQTLDALARVDYPRERWEAVVVDDGSGDDTESRVGRWSEGGEIDLRYLRITNSGPASARNRGAAIARGRALIFIDNDIVVPPSFLRSHLGAQDEHPGCWIIGKIAQPAAHRETPFGRYRDGLLERHQAAGPQPGLVEVVGMTAANLSLPAADFRDLGGFDEGFRIASCEDWELSLRARRRGTRVLYDPSIVVLHNDWAVSLERFCDRQRLYSISDVIFWAKYGEDCGRSRLVLENSPINWAVDPPRLILKKGAKTLLANRLGALLLLAIAGAVERVAPDGRWSHRAYELAIALAIHKGVHEGLRHLGAPDSRPIPGAAQAVSPPAQAS